MKKIFLLLVLPLFMLSYMHAQTIPKGMNYQAVARNLQGGLIANERIGAKITLFSSKDGQRIEYYSEMHEATTTALGLFNLVVGEGVKDQGEYGLVPWNEENIWLEVSIQDKTHAHFTILNSGRLLAVPYAIHAGTTDEIIKSDPPSKASTFAPPVPGIISTDWSVLGNAKTDASGNIYRFNSLGTTDYVDLIMITDNVERLRILAGGDIITKLNFEIGKNLNVGQNLFVAFSATFCDSLIVKKNVLLNTMGGSTTNYGPFTVANLSPTLFTGTLTVDKATEFNTTLNVDRATNLNSRLNVTKDSPTKLSGTLQVNKITNLNDAVNVNNASPTVLTGTLLVDSCATFNDKLKILSTYQTDTSGIMPTGSLQDGGGAYIKKNLYIGGIAKFGGAVSFGGQVTIQDGSQSDTTNDGALRVSGGVGIGLNLNVGGAAKVGGMFTVLNYTESLNDSTGALKVFGGVGIRKRLNVEGATAFSSALRVKGVTSLHHVLNVTNAGPYIAHFINNSNQNGISIEIDNSAPGWDNNFVEFRNGGGNVIGRIEGENSTQYMLNANFKRELETYNTAILRAQLNVTTAAVDVAANVAGLIASAASTTICIGFGVCFTNPIISLIVVAVLKVALSAAALVATAIGLNTANSNKDIYLAFKAARIGVTYESGAGDYAEWLPKANPDETFYPGYIVGVRGGKISKNTTGAASLFVISTKPIVLGNMPAPENKKNFEKVAFMGQVPVFVLGSVNMGDYILPSGRDDGLGRAVSPAMMQPEDYGNMVGVAWSTSDNDDGGFHPVNVAIGLNAGDVTRIVIDQDKIIKEMESEFSESNVQLSKTIPGYKKAATSAGIISNEIAVPKNDRSDKTEQTEAISAFESVMAKLNMLEISTEAISNILEVAEKSFIKNGGDIQQSEFWNRLKNEPSYRDQYIKDMKGVYKNEVKNQLEKLKLSN